VAADPGLRAALRGDLDTIVLKALKKTPGDRYRTADALAEDIERHLADEPVLARPDRAWYRARKFVARNRLAVGASAAVAFALVAGTAVAAWQARVALAEQRRAEEVKAFIASIFDDANPYAGRGARPLTAKEMLVLAKGRIERLGSERADLRVELLNVTAASLLGLGETDAAESIARQAAGEAAALGPAHLQNLRARLLLTDVHRHRGNTREMREPLAALIGQLKPIAEERPEEYVRALMNTAHMEIDDGRPDAAIRAAAEAFALAAARFGERDPRTVDASTLLAESQQYETLTPQAALAAAERGMRFAEAARRDQPAHPQVIYMREVYARALLMEGQDARAVEEASRAMRDAAIAFGPASPMEGTIAGNIVPAQRRLGQIKAALDNSTRGLQIIDRHSQQDSRTRAVHLTGRGVTWLAARNGTQALEDLSEASALLERRAGPTASETLTANLNRALALAYAGRTAEAQARIGPLVEAYRVHTPEHLNYAYYVQG
jgi:serine/threonine-protein kinase